MPFLAPIPDECMDGGYETLGELDRNIANDNDNIKFGDSNTSTKKSRDWKGMYQNSFNHFTK